MNMSTCATFPALEILLCVALLFPPALLSQTPAPPGRLQIDSEPDGANITVNGKLMNQKTPATLVVSPGTYTISVAGESEAGKSENPKCSATPFQVSSGETVELYCSATTWTAKPPASKLGGV